MCIYIYNVCIYPCVYNKILVGRGFNSLFLTIGWWAWGPPFHWLRFHTRNNKQSSGTCNNVQCIRSLFSSSIKDKNIARKRRSLGGLARFLLSRVLQYSFFYYYYYNFPLIFSFEIYERITSFHIYTYGFRVLPN